MFVEQEQKARCSQVGLARRHCIRFAFGFLKVRRPIALASSKRCPCPELVAGNPVGEAAPSPHIAANIVWKLVLGHAKHVCPFVAP
jgi:hypothetical protein